YIDLIQPVEVTSWLEAESTIPAQSTGGDFGSLGGELSDVTGDVKAITSTLRKYMAGDDSSFAHTLNNIERLTEALGRVSVQNEQNLNAIIGNFKSVSENLNLLIARNFSRIDNTAGNMEEITDKIRRGEGTLGKLVNDDATVEKLNESIDNLNDLLGSSNKLQLDMGYHTEYLSSTEQFKHYVSLAVKPKPDKYFLFELVDDPAPDTKHKTKTSQITTNGVTTTVREEIETDDTDRFIFSAQFAKQFYDFTLRGGLIESSGGAGMDYKKGPFGAQFSAFDFETKHGEKPHLKATSTYNITKSFYIMGGADDFINPEQDTDWIMGAGISVTDDDLKSVLGMSRLKP
ncbi:MAG TPA: hypothetical protein DDW49_09690, partial [Deltaproteobacteria bacterium]|nr:hypothetical protein [Deltaproteobacteria bacterium]